MSSNTDIDLNIIPFCIVLALKQKHGSFDGYKARFAARGHRDHDSGKSVCQRHHSQTVFAQITSCIGLNFWTRYVCNRQYASISSVCIKILSKDIKKTRLLVSQVSRALIIDKVYLFTDEIRRLLELDVATDSAESPQNGQYERRPISIFTRISDRLVGILGSYIDNI